MATTPKSENAAPHIALFPSAGMGHLLPSLRLAVMLHSRGCAVTFVTVKPTVSAAESDQLSSFFTTYPKIKRLEFEILPYKSSGFTNTDPFFIQMEAIGNSVHLLQPLLSSLSPSLSAFFADIVITSRICDLASDLSIPTYTMLPTSARFFSLMNYLPQLLSQNNNSTRESVEVPGLGPIALSSIPPIMLDPNHFFSVGITRNVSSLHKLKGVIINTFTEFEPEAIEALRRNGVEHILPIGPYEFFSTEKSNNLPWLDEQAPESVLFVAFGNKAALSKDQIRELAGALEKTGLKFLWVLKGSIVDKEDKEEVEEMVGEEFLERTKNQGVIVKGWVNQDQILAHPAIGGFVSHCGWNSVVEAVRLGVPIVGWPHLGDTRVNGEVVEKAGIGRCFWEWGWGGSRLIGKDEIAEKFVEVMNDEGVRARAKEMKEKARQTRESGGSSETLLRGLIESLKI